MNNLIENVKDTFIEQFNYLATHLIQAPGRVNLIGENTDYNDGYVLPCAINYHTMVAAAKRDDTIIRVISVDHANELDIIDISKPIVFARDRIWVNYVRRVIKLFLALGVKLAGADIVINGNVPQGVGLSSFASLEVVIGQTFKILYGLDINQVEIALAGQQAEYDFVGRNSSITDQLVSVEGEKNHSLLIDCRNLHSYPITMPKGLSVVVINSNKIPAVVDSEYVLRRQQCEDAARFFGVKTLRDVNIDEFNARVYELDEVVAKRARHVITENSRTLETAQALRDNNMTRIALLMAESHASMRYDFEVTIPEVDKLVDIVKDEIKGEGGVRMTGAGFGGCIVALIPRDLVNRVITAVINQYHAATGLNESIYVCHASDGAGMV